MRKQRGFTIVELMVVLAIIGILSALLLVKLQKARIAANETSAISALDSLKSSQELYLSAYGTYAPDLPTLGNKALTSSQNFIDAEFANAGVKSGYSFSALGTLINADGNATGYELNASPQNFGITGYRSFCADAEGDFKFVLIDGTPIGTAAGNCAAIASVPGVAGSL